MRLSSYNIDPFELSIISQNDCPRSPDGVNVNIDDETFSTKTVAGVFRKAGEKIGDGIEYVAGGAKKAYEKITDDDKKEKVERYGRLDERVSSEPQAEWLP